MWLKSGTDCGTCLNACPFSQGLDLTKINQMKDNHTIMDEMMKEYLDTFGRRVFIKKDLPIVRMGEDDESNN
jgi:Fe-S oxidoreductase